jgi:hypothetical protein
LCAHDPSAEVLGKEHLEVADVLYTYGLLLCMRVRTWVHPYLLAHLVAQGEEVPGRALLRRGAAVVARALPPEHPKQALYRAALA